MRIESDSLGTKAVDDAAYYGIHTERARDNFPVTSRPVDGRLVRNLILVKEACANANAETGRLAADKHRMIVGACEAICFRIADSSYSRRRRDEHQHER